ncbi:MAG TPA: hypothetical protein VNX28_19390 [Gemmataceae bacterium]|nr:hypothetical protein [Gemmataceae bacterium]
MNKTWGAEGVFKDRFVIAGTGMVLTALGISGWLLFGGTGSGDNKSSGFTHMHCSVCGEEIPYIAKLAGNTCAVCDSGGTYTPTVGPIKDETSAPSTGAKLMCFLLVAVVLLQGLAYLGVLRFRTLRKASMEARNRLLICRCPYCGRKVGFPAGKAGSGGLCPRCKTAFVLESFA